MRILTNGFETQNLSDFYSGSIAFVYPSYARISGIGIRTSGLTARLDELTEFYTRFAYSNFYNALGDNLRFRITNAAGGTVMALRWSYTSQLSPIKLYLQGSTTQIAAESAPVIRSDYTLFEIHYRYTDQSGPAHSPNIEVRTDGKTILTYNGSTFPTITGTPPPQTFKLGDIHFGNGTVCLLDDVAINDTLGSTDNSWCGDGHVIGLIPNGNGDSSQLTGSDGNSTDNYLLVDEIPANTTDYVESATPGHIDLYQLSNPNPALRTTDVIQRVWVAASARKVAIDPASDSLQLGIKSGSTTSWGNNVDLGIAFRAHRTEDYRVNPATNSPWTAADLTDLQGGVKIV